MTDGTTSVAGASPDITAPIRLEGQTNSEVLFNWLLVNRYLWMLDSAHDAEIERIVGARPRLHLGYKLIKWKREPRHKEHPALASPKDAAARRAAFARLEKLIEIHLFDGDSSEALPQDDDCPGGLEDAAGE